jgi:hypothetical protein
MVDPVGFGLTGDHQMGKLREPLRRPLGDFDSKRHEHRDDG